MRVARIIPPETEDKFSLVKCQGTKVQLPDGSFLPGVTRIEMFADVDNVWRAVIHCHCAPPEVSVLAEVRTEAMPKWKLVILRLLGVRYIDDTDMTDRYRSTRNIKKVSWPWQRNKPKS